MLESVVVVGADAVGDPQLIAYIVTSGEQIPSSEELQEELRTRLPSYMVPSCLIRLDALPLTPHGKVERSALPPPDFSARILSDSYEAPRNDLERTLSDIWSDVLRLERVGIHDNFFQLGGHSLLATQVVSRVRDVLDVEVPLRSLFEARTVEQLSHVIETLRWAQQGAKHPMSDDTWEEIRI